MDRWIQIKEWAIRIVLEQSRGDVQIRNERQEGKTRDKLGRQDRIAKVRKPRAQDNAIRVPDVANGQKVEQAKYEGVDATGMMAKHWSVHVRDRSPL